MHHPSKPLKVLHTSDWHLGRSLYDRKRYDEFTKFLDWLAGFIREQQIDLLLVAGDVFDTTTPSNRAQELYYQFLSKAAQSGCRHIVITGGNHDSPTFLNAPKALLRHFHVYVVGAMTEHPEEEVITLHNESSEAEAIVCAVPYLRDKDVRTVEAGEQMDDKNSKLIAGIAQHYEQIGHIALEKRNGNESIPIIGMGHLFTSGGTTADGDGVRELYVGGAARVDENIFPGCFDYMALGHLHSAQQVGQSEHIRYCGAPIPMGFGEAHQLKKVNVVEFHHNTPTITEYEVPCFQELEKIAGNTEEILQGIDDLKLRGSTAWIEIEYTAAVKDTGLSDRAYAAIAGTGMEILRIKNRCVVEQTLTMAQEDETLDDLNERDVFNRCLDANEIEEPNRSLLLQAYEEILIGMNQTDHQAE